MAFIEDNLPAISRAIYREKIHPTLGTEHKSKVVVIGVKSGDYEIAEFIGWRILPEADIRWLGLVRACSQYSVIASGSEAEFDYCETSVSWYGRQYEIEVFQFVDRSLPGMELLEGHRVAVEAWDGGDVTIHEA